MCGRMDTCVHIEGCKNTGTCIDHSNVLLFHDKGSKALFLFCFKKKSFSIHLAFFFFHLWTHLPADLLYLSSSLDFCNLEIQRSVSEKDCAGGPTVSTPFPLLPPVSAPPELHFSETNSSGDQTTGSSSTNANQSVSCKNSWWTFLQAGSQGFASQPRGWRSAIIPKCAKHKAKRAIRHCPPASGIQTKEKETWGKGWASATQPLSYFECKTSIK